MFLYYHLICSFYTYEFDNRVLFALKSCFSLYYFFYLRKILLFQLYNVRLVTFQVTLTYNTRFIFLMKIFSRCCYFKYSVYRIMNNTFLYIS